MSAVSHSRTPDMPRIRLAHVEDAAAIADLMTLLGHPLTPAEATRRLPRIAGDAVAFVAEDGPRITGLVTAHVLQVLSDARGVLMITALVVGEAARGRGIGRRLVERAEAWGRERGAQRVTVTTALRRTDAHAFYERLGYEFTGRRYGRAL
jgi:GNAT superfamily N-acetyltransferase